MDKNKVLLGVSGGVDSAVAALILKKQGYEVIGVTMDLWNKKDGSSGSTNAINDAKIVCDKLGIQHIVVDFKETFKKDIMDYFKESYKKGITPNPCVRCNKIIKFGLLFEKAKELGAYYISTGHYAKKELSDKYGCYVIKKSKNLKKDQTYVMNRINKDIVKHMLFPLEDFETKDEIRKIAEENGLVNVARKSDSEDICFVPGGDYKEFLNKNYNLKSNSGNIIGLDGKIYGKHEGIFRYTIGQRRGLGIANETPLFVLGVNPEKNEVIVGSEKELYKNKMIINDVNWLVFDDIIDGQELFVKIRYAQKEVKCNIYKLNETEYKVVFEEPVPRITPGQSAVFYLDDILIGGGTILR